MIQYLPVALKKEVSTVKSKNVSIKLLNLQNKITHMVYKFRKGPTTKVAFFVKVGLNFFFCVCVKKGRKHLLTKQDGCRKS